MRMAPVCGGAPSGGRSYDILSERTSEGRLLRLLTILDEYTRECLAIDVDRHIRSDDALDRLSDLFARRGIPDYTPPDSGPEFTAKNVRR